MAEERKVNMRHTVLFKMGFRNRGGYSLGYFIINLLSPVKFFILCTAFFSWKGAMANGELDKRCVFRTCKRFLILYCLWLILYIPRLIRVFVIA